MNKIAEYWFLFVDFIKDINMNITQSWYWLLAFIRDTSTTPLGYWSWVLAFIVVAAITLNYILFPLLKWLYFNGKKELWELPGLLYNEVIWIISAFIRLIGPIAAGIWIAYSFNSKEYEFAVLGILYAIAYIKFYANWKANV